MDNFAAHWIPTGGVTQITGDQTSCISSTDCVKISGTEDQDDWIIRQTSLQILNNLNSYTSFILQYDVVLDNMESSNYCVISYKYDTDSDYSLVGSHQGGSGDSFTGSTASIPVNAAATTLYIKLETDGLFICLFLMFLHIAHEN